MNSSLWGISVGAVVATGSGISVAAGSSVAVAVGTGEAGSVGVGVAVGSGAPVHAEISITAASAMTALNNDLSEEMGMSLAQRAGLGKRSGPKWSGSDLGRRPTIGVQFLHHKLGDARPGVIGWTKRPEQLHGSLHQLDLRDVFCLVVA